jgi:protein SCO1
LNRGESNKSFLKAGILVATLIVPVVFFLWLRFNTRNHFELPRYIPKIDSTSGQVVFAERLNTKTGTTFKDTVFHKVPSFSFTDQFGNNVTSALVQNKIHVANFIFTRCGLICPKTTQQLSRVQDQFIDNDEVKLLSYTVDPEYDKPPVLKEYAKKYDAIAGKWYFLTGDKSKLYHQALKGYFLPVSDASVYDKSITNPDEAFIHSEKMVLVDKEGVIRGYYDGTDRKEVDRLLVEIKVLLNNYK